MNTSTLARAGVISWLALSGCAPAKTGAGADGHESSGVSSEDDGTEAGQTDADAPCVGTDEPIAAGVYECSEPSHWHQKEPAVCDAREVSPCEDPSLGESECSTDEDCGFGSCGQTAVGCYCVHSCSVAADCGPGQTCYCADGTGGQGLCVPANCRTDADCGGFLCAVSQDACGTGLYCTTAADDCERSNTALCTYDVELGKWVASGVLGCP